MLSSAEVDAAATAGQAAAATGAPMTSCPYAAQSTPEQRALARAWVRAYLDQRAPAPGVVDYDDGHADAQRQEA